MHTFRLATVLETMFDRDAQLFFVREVTCRRRIWSLNNEGSIATRSSSSSARWSAAEIGSVAQEEDLGA